MPKHEATALYGFGALAVSRENEPEWKEKLVKVGRVGFATTDKRPPAQTEPAISDKAVSGRNDKKDVWRQENWL